MVLHLLNIRAKKGQLNIGFILSVVLFAALAIIAVTNIVNLFPIFKDKIDEDALRAKAIDITEVLFFSPGLPKDWAANPTVVGLAKYNNYSNETVLGVLDPTKVNNMNASLAYSTVKNSLNIDADIDFRLIMRNSTGQIMDYFNSTAGKTEQVVIIRRIVVINTTPVNVTLIVW